MPTVEGLEFRYALHVLPPGRFPFRRWRWELWHGPQMLAAGWRGSERDAGRALCSHAANFAHRLLGLPAPERAPLPPDLGRRAGRPPPPGPVTRRPLPPRPQAPPPPP